MFVVVRSLSHVWLFATPWTAGLQASLSFAISQSLLKFMSIESQMLSNHLILCHPLLLLVSIFPRIRIFSSESALHIWRPKHWSFSFSISPSNEYSGLISFRIDWFDLLAVQGTLKSLLQLICVSCSPCWSAATLHAGTSVCVFQHGLTGRCRRLLCWINRTVGGSSGPGAQRTFTWDALFPGTRNDRQGKVRSVS